MGLDSIVKRMYVNNAFMIVNALRKELSRARSYWWSEGRVAGKYLYDQLIRNVCSSRFGIDG